MTLVEGFEKDDWALRVASAVEWEKSLTAQVVENLTYYRDLRGLTTASLARLCTELGFPVKRTALAALLIGRRQSVTIQEVLVFSKALDVPTAFLLFPLRTGESAIVTPGDSTHPHFAAEKMHYKRGRGWSWTPANMPFYAEEVTKPQSAYIGYINAAYSFSEMNRRLVDTVCDLAEGNEVTALFGDRLFPGEELRATAFALRVLLIERQKLRDMGLVAPPVSPGWRFLEADGAEPTEIPVLEHLAETTTRERTVYVYDAAAARDGDAEVPRRKVVVRPRGDDSGSSA